MNTPALPSNRKKKKKPQQTHMRIPFFITNLSSSSRVVLPKDHIMAFMTPEDPETNYMEIAEVQSVENECRNWKHPTKMLPKAPESDFLVSPGDIKEVRRCMLPESDITNETCMNPFANFSTNIRQPFPPVVRTLATLNSLLWTLIQASANLCHRDPIHYC